MILIFPGKSYDSRENACGEMSALQHGSRSVYKTQAQGLVKCMGKEVKAGDPTAFARYFPENTYFANFAFHSQAQMRTRENGMNIEQTEECVG